MRVSVCVGGVGGGLIMCAKWLNEQWVFFPEMVHLSYSEVLKRNYEVGKSKRHTL